MTNRITFYLWYMYEFLCEICLERGGAWLRSRRSAQFKVREYVFHLCKKVSPTTIIAL